MYTILCQTHIHPEIDPQGKLTPSEKKDVIYLCLKLLRQNNNNKIILVGHGSTLSNQIIDLADIVLWEDGYALDIYGNTTPTGQPYSIQKGLHLVDTEYCFKLRADCIYYKKNICNYAKNILDLENKSLLVSNQTGPQLYKMTDCFIFGKTTHLKKIWNNHINYYYDGTCNMGKNYCKNIYNIDSDLDDKEWQQICKKDFSFRDVLSIGIMDLRYNYRQVKDRRQEIIDGNFPYSDYFWGRNQNWESGFTEKEFYAYTL